MLADAATQTRCRERKWRDGLLASHVSYSTDSYNTLRSTEVRIKQKKEQKGKLTEKMERCPDEWHPSIILKCESEFVCLFVCLFVKLSRVNYSTAHHENS